MLTVKTRPFPLESPPLPRDGDARSGHGALILQAGSLSLPQATIYKTGPTVKNQNDFEFELEFARSALFDLSLHGV